MSQENPLKAAQRFSKTICFAVAMTCLSRVVAAQSVSLPEPVEWTWEARPTSPSNNLPNVLLLGDSITRAYYPQVTKDLEGVANVYLMATSTSVGDPRLPRQIAEFIALERIRFEVVHFNNGMHGWEYTEAQYRSGFPAFLHAIQNIPKHPRLIWATISPVKSDESAGATNPRIEARNSIAAGFVQAAGVITDDQHALMLIHQDLHEDNVHYKDSGAALMGDQAAATIRQVLSRSSE
jgi:hypothetical protein